MSISVPQELRIPHAKYLVFITCVRHAIVSTYVRSVPTKQHFCTPACTPCRCTAAHPVLCTCSYASHLRHTLPVKVAKVWVFKGLADLHHTISTEVDEHHCIVVLNCAHWLASLIDDDEGGQELV